MDNLTLLAPAKLNLFLHITGRREDGYHLLQTLFQLLDYGDTLSFQLTDSPEILLAPELPDVPAPDNLIVRAARLLQQACGTRRGAMITLDKRLPMGGGLGGGSSNAATTLLALNRLWQSRLDLDQLAALGARLGADVPVFVFGQTAWGEGIGEQLTPVELPENWYLVIMPPCRVSTAEIFAHPDLTRDTHPIKIRAFLERGGRNDCQNLVETLFPKVLQARLWLDNFAPAQMTGSGACVFARFSTKKCAEEALACMPDHLSGFIARGVNQSPAHHQLSSTH